jgi:hypothetical protein
MAMMSYFIVKCRQSPLKQLIALTLLVMPTSTPHLPPYPIRSCAIPVSPSDALAHISELSGYLAVGWFSSVDGLDSFLHLLEKYSHNPYSCS